MSSPGPSTPQVPTACVSNAGGRLSKQRAGACYLELVGMTNSAVPGVTIQMGNDPKDLETVRRKGQEAVDAITVVSRGLRSTKWPDNVSALCAKFAARLESFLPAMRRIAHAATVEEANAAFQQFEQVRGPTGPVPEAVVIRQRLGLPAV